MESKFEEAFKQLSAAGLDVTKMESLGSHCTYRVGGEAKLFVEIHAVEELSALSTITNDLDLDVLVIGKGSNMLVSDKGFSGVAIKLGAEFDYIEIAESTVRVGGITFMPIVARKSVDAGLKGFEWAVGVPGSIGGGVRMNAGGHGSDIAANLTEAKIFDLPTGELTTKTPTELDLSYRSSNIASHQLVVEATLELEPGDYEESKAELSEIVRWRRANQPGGQNAGSVFANPEGNHAAKLIQEAGLKGFSLDTAMVSDKHSNFIQAGADGSADDVYRLIQHIKGVIAEANGIQLRVENKLIGFDQDINQ